MTRDELHQIEALHHDVRAAEALLRAMHVKYHDQPRAHVGVHRAWIRMNLANRRYARAVFHAFAGYVVAAPASLVQRYTGVVVPAFDARR